MNRDVAHGWYPLLAWQLALNLSLSSGDSGTVGEISARIEAMAKQFAEAIEKAQAT